MHKKYLKRLQCRGQSTAEYAVLLAVVAVALVTMQLYIKRGIQGRLRDLATQLAPSPGGTRSGAQQYESPKDSLYTTVQLGTVIEQSDTLTANVIETGPIDIDGDGFGDAITARSGYEVVNKETVP